MFSLIENRHLLFPSENVIEQLKGKYLCDDTEYAKIGRLPLTYRSSDLLCQMEHVPQEHFQGSPDESFGHQRKYEAS